MSGIQPVPGVSPDQLRQAYDIGSAGAAGGAQETSFGRMLTDLVGGVDEMFDHAGQVEQSMLAGEATDVHEVMIAQTEAGVAFTLMLEVRNKLMEAYHELMRMQV